MRIKDKEPRNRVWAFRTTLNQAVQIKALAKKKGMTVTELLYQVLVLILSGKIEL